MFPPDAADYSFKVLQVEKALSKTDYMGRHEGRGTLWLHRER